MIHKYRISGMTCDHCVDSVKNAIEAIEGIESAVVTLIPAQVVIHMHHHVSDEIINEAIARVGNYQVIMDMSSGHSQHDLQSYERMDSNEVVSGEQEGKKDDHSAMFITWNMTMELDLNMVIWDMITIE